MKSASADGKPKVGKTAPGGTAEAKTTFLHSEAQSGASPPPDPCIIVIIGASGDLTSRKLIPALYHLYRNGCLPDPFQIVGCGRTRLNDESFRGKMRAALESSPKADEPWLRKFSSHLHYRPVDYGDLSSFRRLADFLKDLDVRRGCKGNRLFYLAIPPSLYEPVARMLGGTGLAEEGKDGDGWSRIVVEKPFGKDLDSAVALNRSLHEYFEEHQIFRIDHYLAKETVQNILIFRFANSIFEPIWNRQYIDYVSIMAAETLGVENRAGYYEQAGVLRDMFQNHMMQLLSMIAMEPPSLFEADRVRDEKTKVFRSLRPFPTENMHDYIVLGQYGPGEIDGKKVVGYREEPGVRPDSLTPTYAAMKVFIDNWRWQSVPFYLASGKRLARKLTEIVIQFKEVPHSMFRRLLPEPVMANRLTLGIYPEEKISLTFQAKAPGAAVRLRQGTMDFLYAQDHPAPVLEAYEKVLLDCMNGDQMLFWRQDGVELCWAFLTPILEACESCRFRDEMLFSYRAGSWGPEAVAKLTGGKEIFQPL